MRLFIFFIFFTTTKFSFSQEIVFSAYYPENDTIKYSENLQNNKYITKDKTKPKKIIKTIENSELFSVEEFWETGELKAKYQVSDRKKMKIEGLFINYYKNGQIHQFFNYKNNERLGLFEIFYANGNKIAEGEYVIINNNSTQLIKNYWDKQGVQKVINYNGIYEYYNSYNKLMSGKIINGFYEGEWKTTNEDFPKTIEYYKKGKFIKGKLIKSKKEVRKYFNKNEKSTPTEGISNFKTELVNKLIKKCNNINYKINGSLKIKFTVLEDGSLGEFRILESFNEKVDQMAIDVLKEMPKWESSLMNGKEIKSTIVIPVKINNTIDY